MNPKARGVSLDIIEAVRPDDLDNARELNILKPNLIRINGVPVQVPKDSAIEIEPITPNSAVVVRLSLFVGELNIGFEAKGEQPTPAELEERAILQGYVETQGATVTESGIV